MSLKDALAGVKQGQTEHEQEAGSARMESSPTQLRRTKAGKPQPERRSGKSSNPEFEKVGVYVRTETRRRAERKWEDQGGGDLSDLIESLLSQYAVS